MATNVLLLHYNNYFNRTIKTEDSVQGYMDADTTIIVGGDPIIHYLDYQNINFNPSDGVDTSLVLGYGNSQATVQDDYDYCVVYEESGEDPDIVRTIISRWFVMDINRKRENQYQINLRRDVVADNYDSVMEAQTYIEKGYIGASNPLIYNHEGISFNQIKQKEVLLKDKSKCPWLIMYIGKDSAVDGGETINYNPANYNFEEISAQTIQQWSYYNYNASTP